MGKIKLSEKESEKKKKEGVTKRQRNALTLATKMQIIHDKDNGMKISEISLKYNVPKSTVCGLMSRKASLLPIAANIPGTRMETTSRIQTQLWSELDVTVGQWCLRQVNRRVCLSRAIIIAQAKQVHAAICEESQQMQTMRVLLCLPFR